VSSGQRLSPSPRAESPATADAADFASRTEPHRRELLAHCYRMLGSVDDAEDLVQETYLRAWRAFGQLNERGSLRSWLYRIATNVCLTTLRRHPRRRWLPSGVVGPSADLAFATATAATDDRDYDWVQPLPDALVAPESDDPAAVTLLRGNLRLAFIASLQYLPPRQRAVLLLREVLDWPAAEVAEALGTSTVAVKSSLQRARARLDEVAPNMDDLDEPTDADRQAQLETYMSAFEQSDASGLERILRREAVLETMPSPTWFDGRVACLRVIQASVGAPGDWRMLPIAANGQLGNAAYLRGADGRHHAFGVALLTLNRREIGRITLWGDPPLVTRFGLPLELAP
jgi:RNA polymerase sigma-70 factor (ECF subfamily)